MLREHFAEFPLSVLRSQPQGTAMTAFRIHFLPVIALCVFATAVALAGSSRVFELPDHGALTLTVPDSWVDKMNRPTNRLPPTILLRPGAAGSGEVLITAVWPIPSVTNISDEATIRSEVAEAAKKAASQSVEGALPLQELKGTEGRGFYFSATDRAPAPGEYKYLTQGIVRVGEIALAFTVLTDDGQEAVVKAALAMLQSAVHRSGAAI
jgi:hypothetical protein